MKQLIINADDFGMCRNYNTGILELAELGYITSTSVIVSRIDGEQKDQIEKLKLSSLSIGLHVEFFDTNFEHHLYRQFDHFIKIFGKEPSHIDLHSLTYREDGCLFIEDLCKSKLIACRKYHDRADVKMVSQDRISGTTLIAKDMEIKLQNMKHGSYEINFHPGYKDELYLSTYQQERENDIQKIKDMQELLQRYNIQKISYLDL